MEEVKTDEHFKLYETYSKDVKTWFIAYGIGAPIFFLSTDHITSKLSPTGQLPTIVGLFLIGVALQIGISVTNKWNNWFIYMNYEEKKPHVGQCRCIRAASWLSRQAWIDLLVDLGSAVLFVLATLKVFIILS